MIERCRVLDWDSQFFGCRIARLEGARLLPGDVGAIDDWCAAGRIDCLYFLAESGCPQTIATAEANGFGFKDLRITYEWKSALGARGIQPQIGEGVKVRAFTKPDLARLVEIARASHTDSRFFFDQRFNRTRAAELYEIWIRKACESDHVIVGESGGGPAGYLSCHVEDGRAGSIGLAAVDARFHGQGIGRAMIEAALQWFRENGITDIRVVTQGRNVAAHRFYQSAGFLTRTIECWYHKWFTEFSNP
jgi:dTDP-4-amino-4,6-dideoxy-D-galactose acyltransferase